MPAKSVILNEDWSRDLDNLLVGEPITRHITVTAIGQLSTQIPAIEPASSANIKIYPDKPEFRDTAEASGIRAVRRDQYAMIGIASGDVALPEIHLPWWNIDAGEWQVATLQGSTLRIQSSSISVPNLAPLEKAMQEQVPPTEIKVLYVDFWRYVSTGLGGVWIITLMGWWWLRRPKTIKEEKPAPPPIYKRQAKLLKATRKAALAGNEAGVKANLLDWGRLEWPDSAPRSIGELASRVSIPLSTELESLSSATYGREEQEWDGEALARSLRSFSVLTENLVEHHADKLPLLSPARTTT